MTTTPPSVPADEIYIDPQETDRLDAPQHEITALALNIAQTGLINPITVEPAAGRYRIVAGRRRFKALLQLGWHTIPVTIRAYTDRQRAVVKLAENVARSNLSPLEETNQIGPLVELYDNDLGALATALGRSKAWIQDRIDMAAWPENLLINVHEKKLTMSVAKRLARVPDPQQRDYLIHQAITYGCNAQTAALWLRDALTAPQSATELSENQPPTSGMEYRTETQCRCFRCSKWTRLTETIPARICHPCVTELGKAPDLTLREEPVEQTSSAPG